MTRRLRRRGAPEDVATAVVTDLGARGYLDDAAFARQWVETRAARGYGADRLRAELRARGVESSLIDAALAPLTPEAALERARAVARRRLPVLRRGRADRLAARLGDYLSRRGYAPAVVARVVRECAGAGVDG
ncbi:MAG: RecX family transcriptional regulator [Candidatus Rokubacteria bacterium]|nr:RecX family transcriptional regulator [Candidatus Rokubacteria bacterium]